jgi:hypothetical protein
MTKKYTILLLTTFVLTSLLLAACGGNQPAATEDPASQEDQINLIYTQAAETLSAEIAMTEAAQPTATNTPQPSPTTSQLIVTNTLAPTDESTPFPTLPSLPTSTTAPTKAPVTGGRPCLRAEITFESPQDGKVFKPGESFVRYWNFSNSGSCTWNENYSLVHVGGPNFTDSGSLSLDDYSNIGSAGIPNGGLLEMTISMEAPTTPGTYRSYWMLRDDNGQTFGVGSNGDEVMWVDIVVKE